MTLVIDFDVFFSSFTGPIILKALIVGLLTSICASMLGVPLVLKRYSMIGDGLSHMGFFALALATAFGISAKHEIYFTMPVVVLAAVLLLLISESGKVKGDSAIAMISTGSVAVGYLIYNLANKGAADVCSSLFGANISRLDFSDVWFSSLLAIGVIVVFILLYPKIFAVTFDSPFAKSAGTPVTFFNILLAALTAVTIVVGMKMIGAIMISAIIVFPAMAAMRICKHFKKVIILSATFSSINFVIGLFIASVVQFRFGKAPPVGLFTGPCIVTMNVITLLLVIVIKKLVSLFIGKKKKKGADRSAKPQPAAEK